MKSANPAQQLPKSLVAGDQYYNQKQYSAAIKHYQKGLKKAPKDWRFLMAMARTLAEKGEIDQAQYYYQKTLQLNPDEVRSLNNLARIHIDKNQLDQAVTLLRKAIEINPSYVFALQNMVHIYERLGEKEQLVEYKFKWLKLSGGNKQQWLTLGNQLRELRQTNQALIAYQQAAEKDQTDPQPFLSAGLALEWDKRYQEAAKGYQEAVNRAPKNALAHQNLANILTVLQRREEAVKEYSIALELNPDNPRVSQALLFQLRQICDWERVPELEGIVERMNQIGIEKGDSHFSEAPLSNIAWQMDAAKNLSVARLMAEKTAKEGRGKEYWPTDQPINDERSRTEKIKLAYLSSDMQNHPVAHLVSRLFECHNRGRFEIYIYSYGQPSTDSYRQRIINAVDHFVDIHSLTNSEAAQKIADDQVDILIDLNGFTKYNRLEICSYRPTPLQINYLGFPGSTGADFFDYILVDRTIVPEEQAPCYAERLAYLPHSYFHYDNTQPIKDSGYGRAECGLPEDAFVFASFNQNFKLEPIMFAAWMRILLQVKGSVLWLPKSNQTSQTNLANFAQSLGVDPARIIFAGRVPDKSDHLRRMHNIDLGLDTLIYNGHTTTCDALWAGVPVLTLQGKHFASRVSAGLLKAMGVPELITHDLSEFEKRAVHLAGAETELKAIRQKIQQERLTQPLFDTEQFAADLECLLEKIWQARLDNKLPNIIDTAGE